MDRRLRQLERQWLISGSLCDQRRYLRARTRSDDGDEHALRTRLALGLLSRERLLLAARLGHPPARAAVDLLPQHGPIHDPAAWLGPLTDLGKPVAVRALRAVVDAWTALWFDASACEVAS